MVIEPHFFIVLNFIFSAKMSSQNTLHTEVVVPEKIISPLVQDGTKGVGEDDNEEDSVGTLDPEAQEAWNSTRIQMYRYLCTLLSLFVMGMNDAAYGKSPTSLFMLQDQISD